ncbi:tyrosine-type recombinase/integrase [Glaciecola sp. 1036]|uniref:tyrosine-type recombinase/integrase n=1 Tax=Alteromonadaceae TaxID=72275 RepID=UPI003D07965E
MLAKLSVRKDNKILLIEFTYHGIRFREHLGLKESRTNRKIAKIKLEQVNKALMEGAFDIKEHFPNSKNVEKFETIGLDQKALMAKQKRSSAEIESVVTFKAFTKTWLDENDIQWRESHRQNQVSVIKNYLLPKFADRPICDIRRNDILNFRGWLGTLSTSKGERLLSNGRINKIMATLRAIINEASIRFDSQNPFRGISQLKNSPPEVHPFTLAEVFHLLKNVRADYKNYYTVRFFTGMRTGEIDGLKWKYVDFDKKIIQIRETIVDGRQEKQAKTQSSIRDIAMSDMVFDALQTQFKATGSMSSYVFCNVKGDPLAHRNVTRRIWYPLLKELKLKNRKPYQTRHTAATLWLAAGESPEWIARQLGHANTMMLFTVYSRYVPNLTRQDGSAFESLIKANS